MSLIISGTTSTGVSLVAGNNPVSITSSGYVNNNASGTYGIAGPAGTAWTVTNAGMIAGKNGAVSFAAGGAVTNQITGTITGGDDVIQVSGASGTLSNAGVIVGQVEFGGAGGTASNLVTGTIRSGFENAIYILGAASVTNAGTLVSSAQNGVRLAAGGATTNQITGAITGAGGGIVVSGGAGTVTNLGAVSGTSQYGVFFLSGGTVRNESDSAVISGGKDGIYVKGGSGTVTNAGAISGAVLDGIKFVDGGTLVNQIGGTISGATGVFIAGAAGAVTNAGVISGSNDTGVLLSDGGAVVNQVGGTISGGLAVVVSGAAGIMTNAGLILGTSYYGVGFVLTADVTNLGSGTISGAKDGIYFDSAGTVANAGEIQGTGTYGVDLTHGGSVVNQSTGSISGEKDGIYANGAAGTVTNAGAVSGVTNAGVWLGVGGTVDNQATGTIYGPANGIYIIGGPAAVTNAGTILGGGASGTYSAVGLVAGGSVTNLGSGTISGTNDGVYIEGGPGTVTNAGIISGITAAVAFKAGFADRVIVDPGAVFSGLVNGGNTIGATAASTLELASGATQGLLSGLGTQFINFAQVTIDAGAAWTLDGANTLAAGTTLTNAGALTILDGSLADAGSVINNGLIQDDPSTMTLGSLTGTGQVLIGDGSTLAVSGTVAAGETIGFAGNGLLQIAPAAFKGQIDGIGAGGRIELTGITDATSAGFVNGNTLAIQQSSGPTLDLKFDPSQSYAGFTVFVATVAGIDYLDVGALSDVTVIGPGAADSVSGAVATELAASPDGTGGIVVTGADSLLTTTVSTFTVGDTTPGSLTIDDGGSVVTSADAVIANQSGAAGSAVDVNDAAASWQVTGGLDVGDAASGALDIAGGATVTAAALDAGVQTGSDGVITAAGSGSALGLTGSLTVGDSGAGELSVLNGATVQVGGDLDVGQSSGGSGNVDVENAGLTVAGNLNLGLGGGAGVLTVGTGGTLTVTGGLIGGPDSALNEFGAVDPAFDDGVNANVGVSGTQDFPAYIDDFASFTIDAGVSLTLETPSIYNDVAFVLGGRRDTTSDTLVLNAGSVSADTTVTFSNTHGTLVVGTNALASIDIQANDTAAATFVANPNLGIPTIEQFHATIDAFKAGDTIIVDTTGTATFGYQSGATTVSVIENGTTVGALNFDTSADAQAAATTAGALVDQVICFCAGTLIRTPDGEVPVETLAAGDRVLTAGGVARRVVWMGSGRVMVTRGRRSAATPVIVRKGALAENVPHRDLHVTKGHSFYIDDVLIPVEFLVNHRSIVWDDWAQEVTTYHVELETHDVLLANGAPAESYRDDGNRWLFQNGNSGWEQPPKEPCAPVLTGGPIVDAVWRQLLDRTGPRPGLPLTGDPDLHLVVDGRRIDGSHRPNGCWVFNLPPHPSELRMVSRAGAPAELGVARDPRVLGVALRQIRLWQGTKLRVLDAADPALVEGFHAFEQDNLWRWTDGDAALPASLFADVESACQLELLLCGATRYPLLAEAERLVAA